MSKLGRLLEVAVSTGSHPAVRLHIARGDSLEARDKKGRTPLLIAAAKNRAVICKMLLEAGADPAATDPQGRDALSLAIASGSSEAASTIEQYLQSVANSTPQPEPSPSDQAVRIPDRATDQPSYAESHDRGIDKAPATCTGGGMQAEAVADQEPSPHSIQVLDPSCADMCRKSAEPDPISQLEFGDWEPIQRSEPSVNDLSVVQSESQRQHAFNLHVPIDRGASWEDFDAFLPHQARPLPRSDDAGSLQSIRALLRRALREGSVPRLFIEDVWSEQGVGHGCDENTKSILEFIIGDLGGDIDERQEFRSHIPAENFHVEIAENETLEEESQLDDALQHFEDLRSSSNDPLRIYLRSAGSHTLLTADQEMSLAKEMEAAVDLALDALATWPQGMDHLVATLRQSRQDAIALGRIVLTTATSAQDAENLQLIASIDDEEPSTDSDEVDPLLEPEATSEPEVVPYDEDSPYGNPNEIIDWIIDFGTRAQQTRDVSELRAQLGRLRFRRSFLISVADRAATLDTEGAVPYRRAISVLLSARSRMAGANLRLVLDQARKHLRHGAAVEDLIQDGNVGLLSAVDRFDWRRGFRFSTMATWWIRQSITRNLANTLSTIRLPVHLRDRLNHGLRSIEATERQRGRPLSISEQAAVCRLSVKWFEDAVRALSEPISMERMEFECLPETELADDPAEIVAIKERDRVVDGLLSTLVLKDQKVLRMRYGIGVNDELTLEQVGQCLDLTRERIRQIELRALKRLKSGHTIETTAVALGLPIPRRPAPCEASQADE